MKPIRACPAIKREAAMKKVLMHYLRPCYARMALGFVIKFTGTIFDLLLPRVAAGVEIKREDIVRMGEGGLCLNCPVCTYPNCGFAQ